MALSIGHLGTYPQAGTPCTVSSDDGTEDWAMASEREQSGGLL
jgi:hypothetical protein